MPDQAPVPAEKQDSAARKHKSYRDADTQMRVQLDAQQADVFNKVDDVIASFREKPLRRSAGQEGKLAPAAPTTTYRRDLDQSISFGKLILVAVLICGLAVGIYFYSAIADKSVKAKPLADVAQNPPGLAAAPAIEANETNPSAGTNAPAIEPPQKSTKPAESKPRESGKNKKKSSRYSENI